MKKDKNSKFEVQFVLNTYNIGPIIMFKMNSMKKQKDMTLKDELPRSGVVQITTGEELSNNSRKNEEMEPNLKQHPVVNVTSDRSKV